MHLTCSTKKELRNFQMKLHLSYKNINDSKFFEGLKGDLYNLKMKIFNDYKSYEDLELDLEIKFIHYSKWIFIVIV